MIELSEKIEKILPKVAKPSRYIDSEINSVHKDFDSVALKIALIYPDIYDVGISNLGLQILYGVINERELWLAERSYLPWIDMIEAMKAEGIPLFSLESQRSLRDFDVIGITLQHELTFSNIPWILSLADIPVFSQERDRSYPIVLGGGPSAFNPEPVTDFFDALVIGDAEEAIIEVLDVIEKTGRDKIALARVPGVYVPSLYEPEYEQGEFAIIKKLDEAVPERVTKRVIVDLDKAAIPTRPIIPFVDAVHDRSSVEVMRGCGRGCRFCQAGMIYRPVRERSTTNIIEAVNDIIDTSGYDEISLASLSSADFTNIGPLLEQLSTTTDSKHITISLPSLRVDTFSIELAHRLSAVRKSGLTLAPEAGTQRLRDVINKCVTDSDIETTFTQVFEAGWQKVKLYFMIGLPTETEDDIVGIAETVKNIRGLAFEHLPKSAHARLNINVSISSFVPKAHTPFQWFGINEMGTLLDKQDILKRELRVSHVKLKWHDAEQSIFEAALARGDRRVGKLLAAGAEQGLLLDAWSDMFSYLQWERIFSDAGFDLQEMAIRELEVSAPLPWDHISAGINKSWLIEEMRNAMAGKTTADCREACSDCGLCPIVDIVEAAKGRS